VVPDVSAIRQGRAPPGAQGTSGNRRRLRLEHGRIQQQQVPPLERAPRPISSDQPHAEPVADRSAGRGRLRRMQRDRGRADPGDRQRCRQVQRRLPRREPDDRAWPGTPGEQVGGDPPHRPIQRRVGVDRIAIDDGDCVRLLPHPRVEDFRDVHPCPLQARAGRRRDARAITS